MKGQLGHVEVEADLRMRDTHWNAFSEADGKFSVSVNLLNLLSSA